MTDKVSAQTVAERTGTSSNHLAQRSYSPGEITWEPSPDVRSNMRRFIEEVNARRGLSLANYADLHKWSIEEISAFWEEIVRFYDVVGTGLDGTAVTDLKLPGTEWYPGATINFAENILRYASEPQMAQLPAITHISEDDSTEVISWSGLAGRVGSLAANLKRRGVGRGDVVAAVLPNIPEAIIGLLASASIGAMWTISSPDMSVEATLERIRQLNPKVLIGVDGYQFKGHIIDLTAYFDDIADGLPETNIRLMVPRVDLPLGDRAAFEDFSELMMGDYRLAPERVLFDHPLWILFSSGTTGAPKGIVHSHGGITLEAYKGIGLQQDMGPEDKYYVAANTSWMVWNTLAITMMVGTAVVTYDGSPKLGGEDRQFAILARTGATMFATGAAYLTLVEKSDLVPGKKYDFSQLRRIMSTGSPLPPSTWSWVHESVKDDVHLGSDSGGTDICSGLLGSNPLDPVRMGELQGPCLAVAAEAWSDSGERVIEELGEMVVTAPMPSMPVFFWNDPDGKRMNDAYFDWYPNVWRHGDWVTETERGTFLVHGRSDATLNRQGVRLGTADIYAVVEDIPQIQQSLVVGVEYPGGNYYMPLFIQLAQGEKLDEALQEELKTAIRARTSARHVPDEVIAVPDIPMSHTNKRLEVPIKRLYSGLQLSDALNIGSVANPDALNWFVEHAGQVRERFKA